MKLVSYVNLPLEPETFSVKLGAMIGEECIIDLTVAQTWAQGARNFIARELPTSVLALLRNWDDDSQHLEALIELLPGTECLGLKGSGRLPVAYPRGDVFLLPPLPNILSLRDFYGFEQHVRESFRQHGKAVPREWYDIPVFCYGNPYTLLGPDQPLPMPAGGTDLDFELEIACVIGKDGIDIPPEEANDYIAGYMIMNDWSLRDMQQQEMRVGLGPAKGKDFGTSFGPALVTPRELEARQIDEGVGLRYDLEMIARVNGEERSRGNFAEIHWTFAEMIARASQNVMLHPGEVIGSGTVGTGCLLEAGAADTGEWLKPGDWVELEVECLGRLTTEILPPDQAG
ncbi:MAG: fumarylacetoacetate hydrolase family protein [Anaerolineae bacterium]|nr:fumarylacetoacetate hydrolase family protein [Anaerolineae bacterium]